MTETQQRFLRAIAERVPADNVVEVHLFPPMRQGGVETGVAVVAEDPRGSAEPAREEETGPSRDAAPSAGETPPDPSGNGVMPAASLDAADFTTTTPDVPEVASDDAPARAPRPDRYIVHTARYRLTLKGADRGKWEVDVVAEADAPLEAVDAVVRGVLRRSGEGADPDRLTPQTFREALDAPLATLER